MTEAEVRELKRQIGYWEMVAKRATLKAISIKGKLHAGTKRAAKAALNDRAVDQQLGRWAHNPEVAGATPAGAIERATK